jgi:single-strand DNA-binding protein
MQDINSVNLSGRLTKNARLKYAGDNPLLEFSIATNRSVKKGGEWKEEASFFDCFLWGKLGEAIEQKMKKGSMIYVSGELKQDRWKTKDGSSRSKIKIKVNRILIAESSKNKTENIEKNDTENIEKNDDDIPF